MDIKVTIPIKADIVYQGFQVAVSPAGVTWKIEQLGEYAKKSGVYIHHSNGQILYIGKTTTGKWGSFG